MTTRNVEESHLLTDFVIKPVLELPFVPRQILATNLATESEKTVECIHAWIKVRLFFFELSEEAAHCLNKLFGKWAQRIA